MTRFRHFVKGIKNKIFKAAKLVSCLSLKQWLDSIVNMLWWSLATAQGKHSSNKFFVELFVQRSKSEKKIILN